VSDKLPDSSSHLVCIDSDWKTISGHSKENLKDPQLAEMTAYVIYTSGSTGRPKGVQIHHLAMVNLIDAMREQLGFTSDDVMLAVTTVSFDIAAVELYLPIILGGRLVIVSREDTLDVPRLAEEMVRHQANFMQATPSTWRMLIELGWQGKSDLTVLTAGEALTRELAGQLIERSAAIWNLYGPTETTIYSTVHKVERAKGPIPIGRPVANTSIYLLGKSLLPLPVGVPGELYIGGTGVARGYFNRPDITAERFIPNPFSKEPGTRLYNTGDLARYQPDGRVDFLGRVDHQVKIRGFRIELGEIETILRQHQSIKEAVVVAQEGEAAESRLVGYVVPKQNPGPTLSELRKYLNDRLPDYMVPSALVMLDQMPLTPNGKINRGALPAPDGSRPDTEQEFIAPRTPVEEVLTSIWSQVLGIDKVGVEDNFFELGGHSLLATQAISRIRETFQIEIPLQQLFETPNISGLAESIETALIGGEKRLLPPIESLGQEKAGLSFAQQRIWFLTQLDPDSPAFNISSGAHLTSPINISSLEQAFTEVSRRHEVLRTSFQNIDGEPLQVINPARHMSLPVVDLRAIPEPQRLELAQNLSSEDQASPFDIGSAPLLRIRVIQLGEDESLIVVVMHHIVMDGWSMALFTQEMTSLYQVLMSGAPSPLPELAVQYADFAHWQRSWLTGDVRQSYLDYWREALAEGPETLELPADRPRTATTQLIGSVVPVSLDEGLISDLRAVGQAEGASLFMVLLAALQALLSRYSGQDDIAVGTLIANRNHHQVERLIGFFLNTLVLRTDLGGNPDFREIISRVRKLTLGAYAHQDLPFEQVLDGLYTGRDRSFTSLFRVMLVLQNIPTPSTGLLEGRLDSDSVDVEEAERRELDTNRVREINSDLAFFLEEDKGGLSGYLEFNTQLFNRSRIERMLGHFENLLRSLVTQPGQPLWSLSFLAQAELHQLLVEWDRISSDPRMQLCAHQLFESEVEKSPDAVAVVFDGEQVTYRALNARANKLAHYLRAAGVDSEVVVGLYIERGIDLVVGVLGIMKSGGAYLPLDPSYSQDRLAFMATDARAGLIVTQARLITKSLVEQASGSMRFVCLDSDWEVISGYSAENPRARVGPENLAYVIYTSGSTGKPKGVMIAHGSLVNAYLAWEEDYELRSAVSCHLQMARFSFDVFYGDLTRALCSGGKLVICPHEVLLIPEEFYALMRCEQVDFAEFVPVVLRGLIQYLKEVGQSLSFLRLIPVGSDVWYVTEYEELRRFCGDRTRVINSYGLTEATIDNTYFEGEVMDLPSDGLVPIGRPFSNTKTYILDRNLQLLPVGIPGQLHAGGAGLARGYLNRPDLTAEKFIPDPFSKSSAGRLYESGDLARFWEDGNIDFQGRIDNQVKIRGFRIELGEIEAVLGQHPLVKQSVVLAWEMEPRNKSLVAYVVLADQTASPDELRGFLQTQLPDYMVPSGFVLLEEMPVNANGKIDRRALPPPDGLSLQRAVDFVPPESQLEVALANIWTQVLKVEQVGIYDNFFHLGGHSLMAAQVIHRINQAFDLKLSVRSIFEEPTIASLSLLVEEMLIAELEKEDEEELSQQKQ
jgi:amino acid adenylation domain-containing protein